MVSVISKYLDNKKKNPNMSDLNFLIKEPSLPLQHSLKIQSLKIT